METVTNLNQKYAGHVARRQDGRWNTKIIKWRPYLKKNQMKLQTRWYYGLKKTSGPKWIRETQNRNWKLTKEAYVQFCMNEEL